MTATVQAPSLMLTAAHAESQAAMAKYDGPVRAVSSVLFGLASVGLVVVMGFAIRGRQPAEIITEMAPLPVAHIHTSPSEAERVEPPPCTEQQWHAWSWQMLNGGSAAVGEWETFGSPFVGTEYRLGVYKWAVKHKMIGIDGPSKRQVLNDKGTAFCQEYLGATSPTEGFA